MITQADRIKAARLMYDPDEIIAELCDDCNDFVLDCI